MPKYGNVAEDGSPIADGSSLESQVVTLMSQPLASIPPTRAASAQLNEQYEAHMAHLAGEKQLAPKARLRAIIKRHIEPRIKRKNAARERIHAMVESLVKVGVLRRPKNSKPLAMASWKEKLDHWSTHNLRIADVLDILHASWEAGGKQGRFLDWVEQHSAKYLQDKIPRELISKFFDGMQYFGALGREKYRLTAAGGKLYQNGAPFETRGIQTIWEKDVAIFVMSPEGAFYAGEQATGEIHHSSFLAGAPVGAAGEMIVHGGVLQLLTAKSGHYRPGPETLISAIRKLEAMKIPSASYKVRVYELDQKGKPIKNQDASCVDPMTGKRVPKDHSPPFYLSAAWYVPMWRKYSVWGYDELAACVGEPT